MTAFRTTTQPRGAGDRLLVVIVVVMAALAVVQTWGLLRFEPLGMDFLPLWTAGQMVWTQPGKVYDFVAVSAAQAWALPPHFGWLRPYAYPPTTLLLLAPLGRLPFWAADAILSTLSLGIFLYASARLAGRQPALAALLTASLPAVVIAASAGQTVVLTSGLIVLAVLELDRRPRLAGALLALAAILKPQVAIMAPVALIACGGLEALASAGLVAIAALAASALLFGAPRWSEWLACLPAFQQVVESVPRLGGAIITPVWAARELGLQGVGLGLVGVIFTIAGAGLTWSAFRNRAGAAHRVGALALGSLAATPYAMCYDATLIAPVATALVVAGLGRGRPAAALLGLAATFEVTVPYAGLPALAVFAAVLIAELWTATAEDRPPTASMTPSDARL